MGNINYYPIIQQFFEIFLSSSRLEHSYRMPVIWMPEKQKISAKDVLLNKR